MPSEMHQNLLSTRIPGAEHTAQYQVYYQWQKADRANWRRNGDQFVSTTRLLEELGSESGHSIFSLVSKRALGIYITGSITSLAQTTKELAIDSTFGTNNSGMELFAVLAEHEGTGIPLLHFFEEICV